MEEALFEIPSLCPDCAGPAVVRGDFLYCAGAACPSRLSGSLKVWVRNLGLLHIGEATIDSLTADPPAVKSVADLYSLSVEDWSDHCSGMKMAAKCHSALHSNKELPLELIIASLNIPNFGLSTATDIVRGGMDTVEKLLSADFEALKAIPNVGEITARQIQEGLLLRRDVLVALMGVLTVKTVSVGPLSGKSVVITGDLSLPRKTVEKMIMDAGGTAGRSVSKGTTYLVTNDLDTGSKKMQAAKKNGVEIITEGELMSIIRTGPI